MATAIPAASIPGPTGPPPFSIVQGMAIKLGDAGPCPENTPAFASNAQHATTTRTTWEDLDMSKYVMFGSGFVFAVDTVLYPLETLRTKMQADSVTNQRGIIRMAKRIVRQEGVRRLFRGVLPTVTGSFPAQSLFYASYEYSHATYDSWIRHKFHGASPTAKLTGMQDFYCHSLAGLTAETCSALFFLPADMISQRLQTQPHFSFFHQEHQYKGARDVIRSIYRTDGITGYYRGLIPHLLAYAPSGFMYWGVYEASKRVLGSESRSENGTASIIVNATSASLAGGASVLVSNPFDVIRTRVQTYQTTGPPPSTSLSAIFKMAREAHKTEGWSGFSKGLRPRLMVAIPGAMVALTGYEAIKKMAVKDTTEL
ncbi:mitochondrial carrier domain-containing protein [Blastocladiella britannica]|nr:mitochondrial carrier domain-containing protein [Blastocladiella britannica]